MIIRGGENILFSSNPFIVLHLNYVACYRMGGDLNSAIIFIVIFPLPGWVETWIGL